MGKAWRNINLNQSQQGPGAIPAPPGRVWEVWGPWLDLCSPMGTLQPFLLPAEPANTSLQPRSGSALSPHTCRRHSPAKAAPRGEQHSSPRAKPPTKVTGSHPHTEGVRTALGLHSPYKIHQSLSPSCLQHLWQPTPPSSGPGGVLQNPK